MEIDFVDRKHNEHANKRAKYVATFFRQADVIDTKLDYATVKWEKGGGVYKVHSQRGHNMTYTSGEWAKLHEAINMLHDSWYESEGGLVTASTHQDYNEWVFSREPAAGEKKGQDVLLVVSWFAPKGTKREDGQPYFFIRHVASGGQSVKGLGFTINIDEPFPLHAENPEEIVCGGGPVRDYPK